MEATKNYWICFDKYPMASWLASFPKTENEKDVENLLNYSEKIVQLGYELEVLIAKDISLSNYGAPLLPYEEQARWLVKNKSFLPLLSNFEQANSKGDISGKIAYFDREGQIIEDFVSDMVALLHNLRPTGVAEWDWMENMRTAPLVIHGDQQLLNDSGQSDRVIFVTFSILTDIWFPFVMGGMDMDWIKWSEGEYEPFSNLELAQKHTPRLNNFLEQAQQITEASGGEWRVMTPEAFPKFYAPMLTENGIRLDMTETELLKIFSV